MHRRTLLHSWEREVHHDRHQVQGPLSMPLQLQCAAETGLPTSAGSHGMAGANPISVGAEHGLAASAVLPQAGEADDLFQQGAGLHCTASPIDCSFSLPGLLSRQAL